MCDMTSEPQIQEECIILQRGGMYRVPMLQDVDYLLASTTTTPSHTVRKGTHQHKVLLWREDNYRIVGRAASLHPFGAFPPNLAYYDVPKERAPEFDLALDSFSNE
jgi:hypothetical protein